MAQTLSTTHSAELILANGLRTTVRVRFGQTEPLAGEVPMEDFATEILLAIDGDVASAADIGEAILALLRAGEQVQRESAETAARLDQTVADVEAARAEGRDW